MTTQQTNRQSRIGLQYERHAFFQNGAHRSIALVVSLFLIGATDPARAQPGPVVACDVDEDGDVDLDDYSAFVACGTGPRFTHNGTHACTFSDSNSDGHADLLDLGNLQNCFSGSGNPGDGNCAVRPIAVAMSLPCAGGSPPDPSQAPGVDLHKVTISAPDAVCNDGSPGVFYIRRAASPAQANRWVFHIEAGGSCEDFESCRERWCGLGFYTAAKMSSKWAYDSIRVPGIFKRPESALASANLVYFYYCSSDMWAGQRSNAVIAADIDPAQRYTMHFRGHRILEAGLQTLMSGPVMSDAGEEFVPSLANATEVLITGSSAGSNGARFHIDWIASRFDPIQTNVRAVFDTGLSPTADMFDDPATVQLIEENAQQKAQTETDLYQPFWDQSCVQMLGATPDWWRCASGTYTTLNHITTPFFQRMDLTDSNPTSAFLQYFGVSEDEFAAVVIDALAMLPDIGTNAAEAGAIDFVPGVYGPNCSQHVALTSNNHFLTSTVDDANGEPRTFDAALRAWLAGANVFITDTHPAQTSICAANSDTTEPFPIDAAGSPDTPDTYKGLPLQLIDNGGPTVTAVDGVIGVVCIGPSFMNMECENWIERMTSGDLVGQFSSEVVVVNCAVSGAGLDAWNDPLRDPDLWDACIDTEIPAAGIRADQVRVIYGKAVNDNSAITVSYPDPAADYFDIIDNLTTFSSRIATFFPSVAAVYLTSRSYGGYTVPSSEPRPYETGHALNAWLSSNASVGSVWYGWGAYIWAPDCANGVTNGSGVCYDRTDYAADGAHPVIGGRLKISQMMHDRLLQHPWYSP